MTSTIPNTLPVLTDLIFTCTSRFNSCNSHRWETEAQRNDITFRANRGERQKMWAWQWCLEVNSEPLWTKLSSQANGSVQNLTCTSDHDTSPASFWVTFFLGPPHSQELLIVKTFKYNMASHSPRKWHTLDPRTETLFPLSLPHHVLSHKYYLLQEAFSDAPRLASPSFMLTAISNIYPPWNLLLEACLLF